MKIPTRVVICIVKGDHFGKAAKRHVGKITLIPIFIQTWIFLTPNVLERFLTPNFFSIPNSYKGKNRMKNGKIKKQ